MFLGLNNFGLGLLLTVKDLATPFLRRYSGAVAGASAATNSFMSDVSFGFKALAGGLAGFAAGMVALTGLKKAADIAGEFEYEMAGVKVVMKATDDEMRSMADAAMGVGFAMTQFDPVQAAQGLRIFAQAGYGATDAVNALVPTLDMSVASLGQLSLDDSAGLAIAGLKVFRYESERTREMLDKMTQATVMSNMQFKDLPLSLGIVARGAVLVNASLEDTFITLGLVRNVIPTIERGATALATSMEKLAEPKVQQTLRGMGIEVTKANGEFRPFLDVVGDITVALGGMTEKQRGAMTMQLFSKRSMTGMIVVMRQLMDLAGKYKGSLKNNMELAIKDLRTQMEGGVGVMEEFRNTVLDTFKGQGQALLAAGRTWGVAFGTPLAKAVKPVVAALVQSLNWMSESFYNLSEPMQQVIALALWFSAVIVVIGGAVIAIAGLIALIGAVGLTLTGLAEIILIVVAVIVTLGTAIYGMYLAWKNNWLGIRDAVMPVIDYIVTGFDALYQVIKNFDGEFTYMTRSTSDKLDELGMKDFKDFVIVVSMYMHRLMVMWEGVVDGFEMGMSGLEKFFEPLKDVTMYALRQTASALTVVTGKFGTFSGLLDKNTKGWKGFGEMIGQVLTLILAGIGLILYIIYPVILAFGLFAAAIAWVIKWWRELVIAIVLVNPFTAWLAPILALILLWQQIKYLFAKTWAWIIESILMPAAEWMKSLADSWVGKQLGLEVTGFEWAETLAVQLKDMEDILAKGAGRYTPGVGEQDEGPGGRIGKPGSSKVLPRKFLTKIPPPFEGLSPKEMAALAGGAAGAATGNPILVQVLLDGMLVQEALDKKARQDVAAKGAAASAGAMKAAERARESVMKMRFW